MTATIAKQIIDTAAKNVCKGSMASSAKFCLADAREAFFADSFDYAAKRALKSLAYSIGITAPDYRECQTLLNNSL